MHYSLGVVARSGTSATCNPPADAARSRLPGLALLLAFPAAHAAAPNPCAALLASFASPAWRSRSARPRRCRRAPRRRFPMRRRSMPPSGALPRRGRDRAAHRPQRQAVRHRLRAGAARRLERPVPVPGRRRPERQRRPAARRQVAAATTPALARGFAVVSTDTRPQGAVLRRQLLRGPGGHAQLPLPGERQGHGRGEADHRAYYGKPAGALVLRRLLHGRPRGDDDVAALPDLLRRHRRRRARDAHRHSRTSACAGRTWRFNQIAPKDDKGQPQVPRCALSDGDSKLIVRRAAGACDAGDGVTDGMIFNPRACGFDPGDAGLQGRQDRRLPVGGASGRGAARLRRAEGPRGTPGICRLPYDTGITPAARRDPGVC